MKFFDCLFFLLLIIGGLNWGLVGFANYDLVVEFCGLGTSLTKFVYILVGVAAVYNLLFWKSIRNRCGR